MSMIVKRIKGVKVKQEGSVVSALLETVAGQDVIFEIIPEAIPLFVAELMSGRTEARFAAEGGMPVNETGKGDHLVHQGIAATKVVAAHHPDRDTVLVQVLLEGGGVFEFVVPEDQLFRQRPA